MSEVKAYAPGIYARSEDLVWVTRDPDRARTTEEVVEGRRAEDLRRFVEVRRKAASVRIASL